MEVIVKSFQTADHVLAEGFKVNNEKYTVIKPPTTEERVLMGRKVSRSSYF
jgi:hypothetical protein